jgi:hypothetical protein
MGIYTQVNQGKKRQKKKERPIYLKEYAKKLIRKK